MKDTIKRYAQNFLGKTTNRKLLIIESDDWGSILMPNKETYEHLKNTRHHPDQKPYLKYDSLASEQDLNALFETLNSIKDKHNNSPIITANTVVANPDFEAIRSNNFENYVWEPFTTTLKKYPKHQNSFELWREGINNKLFLPQYHGREHLNVFQWMKSLKARDLKLLKAFDLNMITIESEQINKRFSYMAGLDFFSKKEQLTKSKIIQDGYHLFESLFGYPSKTFIANCYVWDKSIEETLHSLGVKYLQGITTQVEPRFKNDGTTYHIFKKHYFGQKNEFNQRYLIRNVFFEPSLSIHKDHLSDCLKRIDIAFKCKKPAIICSHRLNYIGFINEKNRSNNLLILKKLLNQIVVRWPEVEFMATPDLENIF